jgi:hypothetical protein
MITPHFPPDSNAGTHRVRLLAPYLDKYGWKPTVLTVQPSFYEGLPDLGLASLVPDTLRVERSRAIPFEFTRAISFGDLGIRSFRGLYLRAVQLLSAEQYDAIYITVYPTYTALLGPLLKRKFKLPFILDYQDPWVGSWGETVGGGENGNVDAKSRISRRLAIKLEPIAVRAADAITAVSLKTAADVLARIPLERPIPVLELPIGGDARDFEVVRSRNERNSIFDPEDGLLHVSCVGTILPLGVETLEAFLSSLARLREVAPRLFNRVRVHFVGTSNVRTPESRLRVMAAAERLGVADAVSEHPVRVDYCDAINIQLQSSAIILLGSSEHHYTASKIFPALLSGRPVLGIFHTLSTASGILSARAGDRIKLVQFSDECPAAGTVSRIADCLMELLTDAQDSKVTQHSSIDESLSANALAGRFAQLLDQVSPSPDERH